MSADEMVKITVTIMVMVVVYLTLNILGTVYYARLTKRTPALLASVILGWLGLAPLNLASVIVHSTSNHI